jgi:hypothetical protein
MKSYGFRQIKEAELNHSGTTEIKLTVEDGNPANVQVDRDKW